MVVISGSSLINKPVWKNVKEISKEITRAKQKKNVVDLTYTPSWRALEEMLKVLIFTHSDIKQFLHQSTQKMFLPKPAKR